jgi:hypothetical protein
MPDGNTYYELLMLWKQIVEGSPPYLLSMAAAISFVSAVWLGWTNKVAAAALLSGLFLLCVVLAYFPQLDSITAFSVDVRLRKTLDRADETFDQDQEYLCFKCESYLYKCGVLVIVWAGWI